MVCGPIRLVMLVRAMFYYYVSYLHGRLSSADCGNVFVHIHIVGPNVWAVVSAIVTGYVSVAYTR